MSFQRIHFLFHYICYYAAWVLGIEYVANGKGMQATLVVLAITMLQIVWQWLAQERMKGLLLVIFTFTLAGFIIDSMFIYSGVIVFHANPWVHAWSPPWLVSLWVSFAVSYYAVMDRLWGRYYLIGSLSLFAFPAVYYAGVRFGVASMPHGVANLLLYGVTWCVLLPVCDYLSCEPRRVS